MNRGDGWKRRIIRSPLRATAYPTEGGDVSGPRWTYTRTKLENGDRAKRTPKAHFVLLYSEV